MAIQQTTTIDEISIKKNGILEIRKRIDVFDDANPSEIIASNFNRSTLSPGDSLTGQDSKIVAIANATWTTEVVSAYQSQISNTIPTPSIGA
jgi:hypothetical protein